jgi:hypothetical protein
MLNLSVYRSAAALAVIWWMLFQSAPVKASSPPPVARRIALLVGANAAPPDRQPLHYAQQDAEKLAQVLLRVGGYQAADVTVLRDPTPDALLTQLSSIRDQLRAQPPGSETLLFFYYSGHADDAAVYPSGRALPLERVRSILDEPGVTVRLGFIDACRGGGWTHAKGLVPVAPFGVPISALRSEGSVLISSSSGLESAHESELLHGSFFTHHFAAGLLGAADQSGDGAVSLTEAFDYAKRLTIRDTARYTQNPQHPSFDLKLRGRQDLLLSQLPVGKSTVVVEQDRGPLEIVQLSSGTVIAELPRGQRTSRLALAPGRYLVRRVIPRILSTGEVEVPSSGDVVVRERELQPVSTQLLLGSKGVEPQGRLLVTSSTAERGVVELRTGLGIQYSPPLGLGFSGDGAERTPKLLLSAVWGITDRLQWAIGTGAFAYRFGQRGKTEWIPWGGLTQLTLGASSVESFLFQYELGLGINSRTWLSDSTSLILGASVHSGGRLSAIRTEHPTTWRGRFDLGIQLTAKQLVTFNLAAGIEGNVLYEGQLPTAEGGSPQLDLSVSIGAIQDLALRPLPLIQLHLSRWLTLDATAGLSIRVRDGALRDRYMAGLTFLFF